MHNAPAGVTAVDISVGVRGVKRMSSASTPYMSTEPLQIWLLLTIQVQEQWEAVLTQAAQASSAVGATVTPECSRSLDVVAACILLERANLRSR